MHQEAYPEDTGDELSSAEVDVSTGTKSTSAAKIEAREEEHVPRASGDAPGSAGGCVALLFARCLLDIMAAGER